MRRRHLNNQQRAHLDRLNQLIERAVNAYGRGAITSSAYLQEVRPLKRAQKRLLDDGDIAEPRRGKNDHEPY